VGETRNSNKILDEKWKLERLRRFQKNNIERWKVLITAGFWQF
jgi:hypothetical protein